MRPDELASLLTPFFLFPVLVARARAMSVEGKRKLLSARRAHNLLMCAGSFVLGARLLRTLPGRGSLHELICTTPSGRLIADGTFHLWYASKYVEWGDTAMILATGRDLSVLHYTHHLIAPVIVAAQLAGRAVQVPMHDLGMLLNCAVHVPMYAYFAFPTRLKRLRRAITTAQIVQHVISLSGIAYAATARDCDAPAAPLAVGFSAYAVFLWQFVALYAKLYGPARDDLLSKEA